MEKLKTDQGDVTSKIKTDDISKAEARAKRKEAKKNNKGKKDAPKNNEKKPKDEKKEKSAENVKNKPKETKPVEKVVETVNDNTAKENKPVENNKTEVNVTDDVKATHNAAELSKTELRAQRRALQEAQRVAKVNKNVENGQIAPEKQTTPPENKVESMESKAELKAKRRAIQEAQRLAKEKTKSESVKVVLVKNEKPPKVKESVKLKKVVHIPDSITVVPGTNAHKKLQLFHHLYYQHNPLISKELSFNLHSSIIRLGAQYMSHTVLGSNARCLALLSAIKQLVCDYRTPPNEEFCRSLENNLQLSANYLQMCRPLAVSMTNAMRHIKLHLTQINDSLTDDEKKSLLLDGIDTYIRDEIGMADKAISLFVQGKICNEDVILIYGCSSIVLKILLDAHDNGQGKSFRVIVVDSRPLLEGREMLRKLVTAGINCSYVLINAVSYVMGKATKVLLGAHSLLTNGYVMSRTGTAQIALIAKAYNKPVLVCCETYKFCERVQTDSIVHNEIGNPEKVIAMCCKEDYSPLKDWKTSKYVTPLNLMYDVTPADLVTAVVTELAILPCTSVPVILRIKPTEIAV